MSNKKKVNRKRRRSPWFKMFAKTETRLSAHVTCEDDWQTDVPNIRLSRAFVIVLLMHLVVGGALIAFTLMNPNEANAQGQPAKEEEKSDQVASVPTTAEKPPVSPSSGSETEISPKTKPDDMRRHIVHSGDSVAKIARQYGVSPEQIHEVNRIDELYQLYQGRVLRIPVSVSTPVELNSRIAESPSTNGSNAVSDPPSRGPETVPRAMVAGTVDTAANSDYELIDHSSMDTGEGASRAELVEEAPEPARVAVEVPVAPLVAERTPDVPKVVPAKAAIVRPREEQQSTRPAAASPKTQQETYKVQKGDNPFRIAQQFGVHYKELLKHNGITDPSKLQIGKVLSIPN